VEVWRTARRSRRLIVSLRVVVYAEGAGELGGELPPPAAAGEPLEDRHLGPVHFLAKRSIELVRGVPTEAVRFEQGLRKKDAEMARGSDFVRRRTLLQLLVWPLHDMRPELAIVFVDEDGERARHKELCEWVRTLEYGRPPTVIAVSREEFESWLITDRACVANVLGSVLEDGGSPEDWPRGEAKRRLQRAIDESSKVNWASTSEVRRRICECCDLQVLRRGSRSFERFLYDLARP